MLPTNLSASCSGVVGTTRLDAADGSTVLSRPLDGDVETSWLLPGEGQDFVFVLVGLEIEKNKKRGVLQRCQLLEIRNREDLYLTSNNVRIAPDPCGRGPALGF